METTTTFSDETLELLEEVIDRDDALEFIEEHGEQSFINSYEDYVRMIDEFSEDIVAAFLGADFDIDDIEHLRDAYYGEYESGEDFAECFVRDCYGLPEMPYWIAIDWKETWDNLSYDYSEYNGYIFCNNW